MADKLNCEDLEKKIEELEEENSRLKQSDKQLDFISQNIPDIIFKLDPKGVITYINDVVILYGYLAEDLIGKDVFEIVHPDDVEKVKHRLMERRTGLRITKDLQVRLFTKSGEERTFESRAGTEPSFYIAAEGMYSSNEPSLETFIGTQGIARDVTQRVKVGKELEDHRIELIAQNEQLLKTQKKILESEVKYRSIVDNAPVVNWISNINGETPFISDNVEDILGYTAKEIKENPELWLGGVYPEDSDRVQKEFGKYIQRHKEKFDTQYRLRHKDKHWVWIHDRSSHIEEIDGIPHAYGAFVDITERKIAEEALKESEQRLNQAQEVAHIGSWNLDMITNDLIWSDEAYRIFGFSPKDMSLTYEKFLEFVHPEDKEYVDKKWNSAMNREEEYNIEHRIIVDDKIKWVNERAFIEFNERGEPISGIGTVQDITEQKEVEQALREERDFNETIIQSSPTYFVAIDAQGKVKLMNNSMLHATGYSIDEVIGKDYLSSFVLERDREELSRVFSRIIRDKTDTQNENYILTKDGKELLVEWRGRSILKEEDKIEYFMGFGRDITEIKKAEIERNQLQQRLLQAQKMEAIGTLAGGLAHDYNNIIGAARSNLELIQMYDVSIPEEVQHHIDEALTAIERSIDLTRQLLTFSRERKEEKTEFYVQPVVKEALKFLRASIPSTIKIEQDLSQKKDRILGDPTSINQIVINLCTNAFHAMEEKGGVMEVKLDDTTIGKEDLILYPELTIGNYVHISVSDTGHGIKQKDLDKIFDPFFTTKVEGKGTGLGLAMVYGIVNDYGGTVKVYSEIDQGTKFHIYIPKYEEEIKAQNEIAKETIIRGNGNILLVDDDKPMLDAVKMSLTLMGYDVMVYENSLDALVAFNNEPNKYDLVMTDLTMPDLTGDKLADKIHEIRSDIPIILSSGRNIEHEKSDIIYLPKPYDLVTVSKLISENIK